VPDAWGMAWVLKECIGSIRDSDAWRIIKYRFTHCKVADEYLCVVGLRVRDWISNCHLGNI
jgi:hypothetical protein